MNQAFKQLESRIQELVLKLQQTGSENTQLNQKLASVQQELEQKTWQLAAEREQHAKVADLAAQNSGSNDELSEKLQFQEHQLQLLERERLNRLSAKHHSKQRKGLAREKSGHPLRAERAGTAFPIGRCGNFAENRAAEKRFAECRAASKQPATGIGCAAANPTAAKSAI